MQSSVSKSHSGQRISTGQPMAVVDVLERRCLLAASLAADGTLQVTGTDGPDVVTLRLGASANHLNVQEGTTTLFVFLLDRVNSVSVRLGGGNDTLNLDTGPGLLLGARGEMPIVIDGEGGTDALHVFGAPAGGNVNEVLTVGPAAGSGMLASRVAAGPTQSVRFGSVESFVDTSAAVMFTAVGNDGQNVVELTSGPLAGGVTPTGTVRFLDVAPTPAPAFTGSSPTKIANESAPMAVGRGSSASIAPLSRRDARRQGKEAKREAQKLAKEAKRLARAQKRAERLQKRKGAPAPAAALPQPAGRRSEAFQIDRDHVAVHFANKAAITIEAKGGDDRIDLNIAGATPAGLASLTIDGGAGADRLYEQAVPVGVAVLRANIEATPTTRDYTLIADRPPLVEPPIPDAPPPSIADNGDAFDDDSVDENRKDGDDAGDDSVDEDREGNDHSRDDSVDEDRKDDTDD